MTKYKHRIDTLDGPIDWEEDDIPPTIRKTPEEEEDREAGNK